MSFFYKKPWALGVEMKKFLWSLKGQSMNFTDDTLMCRVIKGYKNNYMKCQQNSFQLFTPVQHSSLKIHYLHLEVFYILCEFVTIYVQ